MTDCRHCGSEHPPVVSYCSSRCWQADNRRPLHEATVFGTLVLIAMLVAAVAIVVLIGSFTWGWCPATLSTL